MEKLSLFLFLLFFLFSFMLLKPLMPSNFVEAAGATLYLSPQSGSLNVNDVFDIGVLVNTGGAKVAGVDVYINYQPDMIKLEEIVTGKIFDQYVGKMIDNTNGKASLSGLASSSNTLFSGTGTFATLRFRGLKRGVANVSFDFTPQSRNDSNVADATTEEDILTSVVGGTYTIHTGVSSGVGGSDGGSYTSGNKEYQPLVAGGVFYTVFLIFLGIVVALFGILGLRRLV